MIGSEMRAIRERRGLTQPDFAAWLNDTLNRRYDGAKISRWETEREKIPREIEGTLLIASLGGRELRGGGRPLVLSTTLTKGGSAKTESAVNIAYILARAGYRTLLVDADSQANASVHVGLDKERLVALTKARLTLADVILDRATAADAIVAVEQAPNLDLLPSSIALARAESELNGQPFGRLARLSEVIRSVGDRYDFVIIDCAPAIGTVTLNALVAADCVLMPCQTESFAVMAVEDLVQETIGALTKRENPRLKVLGILPTLYNARQTQDRASLDEIHALWGPRFKVYDPVPRSAVYAQASAAQTITLAADPGAPGVESYVAIARDLIDAAERMEAADAA